MARKKKQLKPSLWSLLNQLLKKKDKEYLLITLVEFAEDHDQEEALKQYIQEVLDDIEDYEDLRRHDALGLND